MKARPTLHRRGRSDGANYIVGVGTGVGVGAGGGTGTGVGVGVIGGGDPGRPEGLGSGSGPGRGVTGDAGKTKGERLPDVSPFATARTTKRDAAIK